MILKPTRDIVEKVAGAVLRADKKLEDARGELQDDYFRLRSYLANGLGENGQVFVCRVRARYNSGSRNFYYRFAGEWAQRNYDLCWHALGFALKQNQDRVGVPGI
ncbi:hypothetical protein J4233_01350 [Candidatus Pacearchaeota archaeon]|nr:hypothetical protein [Candidatus Pacearchaeota archaeon]